MTIRENRTPRPVRSSSRPGARRHLHSVGLCPSCGKVRYKDRKDARKARQLHPSEHLRAYSCSGGYWHFGHPPIHYTDPVEESNVIELWPRPWAEPDEDQQWAA